MILSIIQLIIAVLLIAVVLLQTQGTGLSTAFGGGGESFRSKRSMEKLLVWITILLAFVFATISVLLLIPR